MKNNRTISLGAGAGFSGDRIEPAIELAFSGQIDYLIFECLAERTIALATAQRQANPLLGYDPLLEARMRAVLPALHLHNFKIITNMGAANPLAAAQKTAHIVQELGLKKRVFAVLGDDVLAHFQDVTNVVSANAYTGHEGILEALQKGADIIITGRVADPTLFLAPLIHEFKWHTPDQFGAGIMAGHLLECAGQITGGYFSDPPYKTVPRLEALGFPIGEVNEKGEVIITKLPHTGGVVNLQTCKEQILYEIMNPAEYLQPDAIADFSHVTMQEIGENRVSIKGARGKPAPTHLKVSVGYQDGFIGEGQISYAGNNALARGELALEIMRSRLARVPLQDARYELMGVNALHDLNNENEPYEVRVRVAARAQNEAHAKRIGQEVEALYTCGPAGGGGVFKTSRPVLAIASRLIEREKVRQSVVEVTL